MSNPTHERVKRLEQHLQRENPVLAGCVSSFRKLDRVARGLGVMGEEDSFATRVSWWPVISLLGTFSAGKSTFINQYVGHDMQRTGNQAVDDKFTVVCYGTDDGGTALPGLALDSDPRFPFYQISRSIEEGIAGEGRRIDSYLQLKTVQAEPLRGKIIIDSPGFDADQQRDSTLLITDHIIDLSDLVLVFFDARHPEPGAMKDTLRHLVADTIKRVDANKFLYILNQIDNTAREDNAEDVVAAWQRALAQQGLTAGRFYRIFARGVDVQVEDEGVRQRLVSKRDEDLAEIESRIKQVEVERAYRVVGMLEKTAKYLRDDLVPRLTRARRMWRKRTLILSGAALGLLAAVFFWLTLQLGWWEGLTLVPFAGAPLTMQAGVLVAAAVAVVLIHMKMRRLAGRWTLRTLARDKSLEGDQGRFLKAFESNVNAWWFFLTSSRPMGWTKRRAKRLESVLAEADRLVQSLNDKYARPSGQAEKG